MRKKRFIFWAALALVFGLVAVTWLPRFLRVQPRPVERLLFQGIGYQRLVRRSPRALVIHLVTVDLRTAGLSFLVTPGEAGKELPLAARTSSKFLKEFDLQLVINGDGFQPWRSGTIFNEYPRQGDPVAPIGLAASRGQIYAQPSDNEPVLYISRTNQARFNTPIGRVYNAISGNRMLLERGELAVDLVSDPEPRTAVGLDQRSRRLILVVVDGRQPGYSEGMTLDELAQLLLEAGAFNAMNMDGGGSSTLVVEGLFGQAQVLNSPVNRQVPGRERPVGNHLGIYAPAVP